MNFVLRKLAETVFVVWAVATILFLIFRLMPGSPLVAFIDPNFTPEQQAALIQRFGLDQSLGHQYGLFLANLLHFDLGESFFYRQSVASLIGEVFPNTMLLTVTALLVAYAFGVPMGAILAWKRGTAVEHVSVPIVLATRAAPEFWVGMIMLAVFSFALGWFPAGGATTAGAEFDGLFNRIATRDFLLHLTLPALTLAIYLQGLPLLLMRSTMLDVLGEDFITLARMKGFSEWTVMMRHAARNALLPVATTFALGIGYSIGGDVVVETVFSWPGLGRLLIRAVQARDYPLAQGAFLLIALVAILMNTVADLLYRLLDPRVAHAG